MLPIDATAPAFAGHASVIMVVKALNTAWQQGRFDELEKFFDANAVLLQTNGNRIEGREPIVESYRQFATLATIKEFNVHVESVDVWARTALATVRWDGVWQQAGNPVCESGRELLLFQLSDNAWRVVWRTVLVDQR